MAAAPAVPAVPAVPQLTQEQKQENAQSGIYYADSNTKIVCFGDLEGTSLRKLINPGRASTISETGVLKNTVSNLTELYEYLTVDSQGKLILQQNVILVCLGDVIGDGPDNIELATTLLNLKRDNPTRVILIIGNRDLIKIRLGWELAPTDACMTDLTTRVNTFVGGVRSAFDGFEFAFERNEAVDFDYMWNPHPEKISKELTCLERVITITEGTMGEYYAWVFLVDEYLTNLSFKPEQLKDISDEVKSYIYVYLVQAMSGAIDCDVLGFNGIFEKLLRAGHLMACIDADNRGKFGFMHSLPPRGKIPTTPGFIYKEQYDAGIVEVSLTDKEIDAKKTVAKVKDSDITSANKVEINEGLREFNQSLRTLIETYRGGTPEVLRELLELVSAVTTGSYWLYKNNNRISGANMPVSTVSFGSGFGQFEAASDITVQSGGGITHLENSIATRYIDIKDFTHVVCSHSPKGYVGVKVRTSDGKFYYCVDVSKIDDQEYDVKERFGCCFLIFDLSKISADGNVNDKFIGRIMLKQSQFPTDYAIFANKPIKGTMFAHGNPMFANYFLGSPIPVSSKIKMEQRLPLKIGNTDYVFEYINGGKEKRNFERKSGVKELEYFTKMPTLTLAAAKGGSRTRKRRSRYLKKSARTTHKRRHISKKRKNNNNKRKDKKSVRK